MKKHKIAFLGRGALGMQVLNNLLKDDHSEVVLIISCAPTPEVAFKQTDFQRLAENHGIEFHSTNNINTDFFRKKFESLEVDLAVAMLWLFTISEEIINTVRLGFLNLHGGELPKYRGNACQTWAILNDEDHIAVTCHLMKGGELDSGPILRQQTIELDGSESVNDLIQRVESIGCSLVISCVDDILNSRLKPIEQNNAEASYCYPRLPRDGEIDWNSPASSICKLVRAAGKPYPGAYTWYSDHTLRGKIRKLVIYSAYVEEHPLSSFHAVPGHLIKLEGGAKWAVACGDCELLVLEEIAVDDEPIKPSKLFKTVRQRFGLDSSSIIASLYERIQKLENSKINHSTADSLQDSDLTKSISTRIESLVCETSEVVNDLANSFTNFPQGISIELNQLRNYSFQKRFFDWEQKERWFGIQIYRSITFVKNDLKLCSLGYWNWSDSGMEPEKRIFLSKIPQSNSTSWEFCLKLFKEQFADSLTHSHHYETNDIHSIYALQDFKDKESSVNTLKKVVLALWEELS